MLVMRRTFLLIIFIFIYHISSAPLIDFRMRLTEFRSMSEYVEMKYHDSEFSRFINNLGRRESGNNWLCINRIGCFGEWQFAESTLWYLGYRKVTLKKFKSDPAIFPREMQVKALKVLINVNLIYLIDYEHFIGDTIRGVVVTKSGMIAASHLGGAGSLKRFLNSNGRVNKRDVLGTSIYEYLRKFNDYDLE